MPATWIEASRSPVVPGTRVHASAATPLLLFVVWWSWITLWILLVVTGVMTWIELKGRRPAWVLRRAKGRLRGNLVAARPTFYRRRRSRIESYEHLPIEQAFSLAGAGAAAPRPVGQADTPVTRRKGA